MRRLRRPKAWASTMPAMSMAAGPARWRCGAGPSADLSDNATCNHPPRSGRVIRLRRLQGAFPFHGNIGVVHAPSDGKWCRRWNKTLPPASVVGHRPTRQDNSVLAVCFLHDDLDLFPAFEPKRHILTGERSLQSAEISGHPAASILACWVHEYVDVIFHFAKIIATDKQTALS